METYEGRLASFKLHPSKRKVNEAYSSTTAWPHHPTRFSVTPATLANAGFYHDPTESATDNVTCVYCSKGLEGWENGDDALDEHLKRVIDKNTGDKCPWATMMGIKRDFDLFGPSELDGGNHDPMAQHLITARKKTFGEWWKFDGKKGWKPTSERLAQAGFYNTPLVDSPDTCTCPYCDVQLDGWSKTDDPEEEHRSRQPDCFFFTARASTSNINAKSSKVNLKASTSTTRGKAAARDENVIEMEEEEESQPTKSNKLTASTSSRKKVPKKRSATETSIAEEAVSNPAEKKDTIDETIQDIDDIPNNKEEKKPAKAHAAKSRKSKAASSNTTTTATKKGTSKAAKGKSKSSASSASTAANLDSVIDLASESEADAPLPPSPPPETKPPPKTRKRTTRATTEVTSCDIGPPSPEPAETKKTRSTAAKSRSKKAIQEADHEEVESAVALSDNGLTTENETEASEAEPSNNKRSTRSKLAKSTSSAESRNTRAKGKKAITSAAQSEVEVMSVSEASEVDETIAEESKVLSKKASSVRSGKSTRSTSSSSRKNENKATKEEIQATPSQSIQAIELPPIDDIAEEIQEPEILPLKKAAAKKAPPPRKATKGKSTKKPLAASTTRSTRSGHASDSVVQSESEASYATQTDDETMEETIAEMTRGEPSRVEIMDASTPKAVIKSNTRTEETKVDPPAMYIKPVSADNDVRPQEPVIEAPLQREVPESQPQLKQPSENPAEAISASPQNRPDRTVKALPARKSRGESPLVSIPATSSIFTQPENRSKPNSSITSALPRTRPLPSRENFSRGQSALDALLAGPVPTFDSPEKVSSISQTAKPIPKPASTTPLAPASPALKQTLRMTNAVLDDRTTVKEWLAILHQQEMERFDLESKKLLAEFDKQTQKKREELSALLRQR